MLWYEGRAVNFSISCYFFKHMYFTHTYVHTCVHVFKHVYANTYVCMCINNKCLLNIIKLLHNQFFHAHSSAQSATVATHLSADHYTYTYVHTYTCEGQCVWRSFQKLCFYVYIYVRMYVFVFMCAITVVKSFTRTQLLFFLLLLLFLLPTLRQLLAIINKPNINAINL